MIDAPRLERIARGGARVTVVPRPAEIHAAVSDLDTARDLVLLLRGSDAAGAQHVISVTPAADNEAVVCWDRGHERRWLARGDDVAPRPDLDGLPAKALVPRTWASSVLAHAPTGEGWPRVFPWHDASFVPLGALSWSAFSFERCARDTAACVPALARAIGQHVRSGDYETSCEDVVAELRRVGHDLWSLDGGGREIWGADYVRTAKGQGLTLELGPAGVLVCFGDTTAEG